MYDHRRITTRLLVLFLAVLVATMALAGVVLVRAGGAATVLTMVGVLALLGVGGIAWDAASRRVPPAATGPARPAAPAPPTPAVAGRAGDTAPRAERRRMRAGDPAPIDVIETAGLHGSNGGNGHTRHDGFEEF